MDIPRPDQSGARWRKRVVYGVAAMSIAATLLLMRLKPAVPAIDSSILL